MKLYFYFLIFFITSNLFSQQWPAQNTTWTYCEGPIPYEWAELCCAGPSTWHYASDTIINNKTYNISKPINLISLSNEDGAYYTRYSNDTVYRWVNNTDYLFFHFQLKMDEIFTTYRSIGGSSDTSCTSILPLKVIDSTSVTINQEQVTKWTLIDTLGTTNQTNGVVFQQEFILYEKYGFKSSLWLSNPWEIANCNLITDIGYSYLSGYNDDTTNEWIASCPTTGINEQNSTNIKIYPNPFSDYVILSSLTKGFLTITDSNGKIIIKTFCKDNETVVSLNLLQKGVYFYEFSNNNKETITRGKLIKN